MVPDRDGSPLYLLRILCSLTARLTLSCPPTSGKSDRIIIALGNLPLKAQWSRCQLLRDTLRFLYPLPRCDSPDVNCYVIRSASSVKAHRSFGSLQSARFVFVAQKRVMDIKKAVKLGFDLSHLPLSHQRLLIHCRRQLLQSGSKSLRRITLKLLRQGSVIESEVGFLTCSGYLFPDPLNEMTTRNRETVAWHFVYFGLLEFCIIGQRTAQEWLWKSSLRICRSLAPSK